LLTLAEQFGSDSLAQNRIAVHESFPVRFVELIGGGAHTILEFQWIKICCIVKEIDVFTSLEPQGYFKGYRQQDKFRANLCKACDDDAPG
jgi:hypothetical protein